MLPEKIKFSGEKISSFLVVEHLLKVSDSYLNFGVLGTEIFMEGLVGSSQITQIPVRFRQSHLPFRPAFSLKFGRSSSRSRFGMKNRHKSFNPVVASVQKLETSTLSNYNNTQPSKGIIELWRNANAVCFDVDSTVCVDEGIDELAEFCGAGKAVAEWTAMAMSGSVPFQDALAARLSLFNPSLSQVEEFLEKKPPRYKFFIPNYFLLLSLELEYLGLLFA